MFRSVGEVETLRRTIGIVDQEIARRRSDINRNLVANVGLASRHLELLERHRDLGVTHFTGNHPHSDTLSFHNGKVFPWLIKNLTI